MLIRPIRSCALLALAYVAGLAIAAAFFVLRLVGRIRVDFKDRRPRWQRSMLIVTNHPSLIEAFMLPVLFFPEWAFAPAKWGPWSMPDRANQKKLSWFFWIGSARNIPVPRQRAPDESEAAFEHARLRSRYRLLAVLRSGGRVFMFPEGGRTTSVPADERLRSISGKELRPLRDRVGEIILRTNALVLPIWIEFPGDRVWLRFKFGQAVRFRPGIRPHAVVRHLENALLRLADEEPAGSAVDRSRT
jgi:1-acyl-sn-glycerol-3-phosphate acyltransferase